MPKNNILGFICRNCNLQINNKNEISLIFHNGSNYDNSILLNRMSKLNPKIKCIGISSEKFKSIDFRFKDFCIDDDGNEYTDKYKYSFKVMDSAYFLKGPLSDLSQNLHDNYKIETKKQFKENSKLMNEKMSFPYEWITKDNLKNKELPNIKEFYSSLKLKTISEEDYNKKLEIYKKFKFKNIKDYLDNYLKLDLTLSCDVFENFRKKHL